MDASIPLLFTPRLSLITLSESWIIYLYKPHACGWFELWVFQCKSSFTFQQSRSISSFVFFRILSISNGRKYYSDMSILIRVIAITVFWVLLFITKFTKSKEIITAYDFACNTIENNDEPHKLNSESYGRSHRFYFTLGERADGRLVEFYVIFSCVWSMIHFVFIKAIDYSKF